MSSPTSRAAADDAFKAAGAREAWHRLLQVSSRVLRALDSSLDERERMMVSEFDVLITLDNAPDRRLRMTELANATVLSSGGMTRLVGRLEQRGLVRRDPDPGDARAFHASLTETGQAKLAQARFTHDSVVEVLIGAPLTANELTQLENTLRKLIPSANL